MDQLIKAKQKTPRISGGLIILKAAVAETAVLEAVGGQTDLSSSVGEGEGGNARDCRSYEMVHGRQLRIRAVSYTHLRAHETAIDLVCRLLPSPRDRHRSRMPSSA